MFLQARPQGDGKVAVLGFPCCSGAWPCGHLTVKAGCEWAVYLNIKQNENSDLIWPLEFLIHMASPSTSVPRWEPLVGTQELGGCIWKVIAPAHCPEL